MFPATLVVEAVLSGAVRTDCGGVDDPLGTFTGDTGVLVSEDEFFESFEHHVCFIETNSVSQQQQ